MQTYKGGRSTVKKWVCRVWGPLLSCFVDTGKGAKNYVIFPPLRPEYSTSVAESTRRSHASMHHRQAIKAQFVPPYLEIVFRRAEIKNPSALRGDHDKWAGMLHNRFFFKQKDAVNASSMHKGFSTGQNLTTWPSNGFAIAVIRREPNPFLSHNSAWFFLLFGISK